MRPNPRFLLILVTVLAAALRLPHLGDQSLWWDETASWLQAKDGFVDMLVRTSQDNYPPLHNMMLFASIKLFGDAEWALRLPSAILGIATIPAIYWVARLLTGPRGALLAALLLAISGFHVWFSLEARMYALLALCATLYFGASLCFAATGKLRWGFASFVSGACLLYSHPYGALTFVGMAGSLLALKVLKPGLFRAHTWQLLIVGFLVVLTFLPWLRFMLKRASDVAEGFWIPDLTVPVVFGQVLDVLNGPWMFAFLALAACWLVVGLFRRNPVGGSDADWAKGTLLLPRWTGIVLLFCWMILPLSFGIIISLIVQPIFTPRYIIGSLPAALILIGIAINNTRPAYVTAVAASLVVVASVAGFIAYSPLARSDWRSVSALVTTTMKPGDCLVAASRASTGTLSYYLRPLPPCFDREGRPDADDANRYVGKTAYVILVENRAPLAFMDALSKTHDRKDFQFFRISLARFVPKPSPAGRLPEWFTSRSQWFNGR